MADLTHRQSAGFTKITNADENRTVDVNLYAGINKAEVNATVTVEEIFGKDPIPDTYFTINNAGNLNDTIRVQIAATANDPSNPDRDAPAVDKTVTITASEVGDELAARDLIISQLNADANFSNSLKAQKAKDNAVVHITSKFRGAFWERSNANDVQITTTGIANATLGYDTIKIRGKATSLARDPDSPHNLGILGISGSVTVTPGALNKIYSKYAKNGTSSALNVDGSSTPIIFQIFADSSEDIFVDQLLLYGTCAGIKFGQFLSINNALNNGLLIVIKSDDLVTTFDTITTTEEMQSIFASGAKGFQMFQTPALDSFSAVKEFITPFPIRAQGTFSTDDYIKITVRDNLSSISELRFNAKGFLREV